MISLLIIDRNHIGLFDAMARECRLAWNCTQRESFSFIKPFHQGQVSRAHIQQHPTHGSRQGTERLLLVCVRVTIRIQSRFRRHILIHHSRPITTYSGQGVAKAGIDRSKHAVIHMRGDRPRTVRSEPRMAKEPLEVDPARPDQKLDCMSRVNFGKVYTVEHNVKVLPVGKITEASRARFLEYAQGEFAG